MFWTVLHLEFQIILVDSKDPWGQVFLYTGSLAGSCIFSTDHAVLPGNRNEIVSNVL